MNQKCEIHGNEHPAWLCPDAPEPEAACTCDYQQSNAVQVDPACPVPGHGTPESEATAFTPDDRATQTQMAAVSRQVAKEITTPTAPVTPDAGEEGAWHFLDKRSKAIANREGLKLEFASHQDAEIGRQVLNTQADTIAALEAERDDEVAGSELLAHRLRKAEARVSVLEAKAGLADWWGTPATEDGDTSRALEVALWLDVVDEQVLDKDPLDSNMQPGIRAWQAEYDALAQATPPEEA